MNEINSPPRPRVGLSGNSKTMKDRDSNPMTTRREWLAHGFSMKNQVVAILLFAIGPWLVHPYIHPHTLFHLQSAEGSPCGKDEDSQAPGSDSHGDEEGCELCVAYSNPPPSIFSQASLLTYLKVREEPHRVPDETVLPSFPSWTSSISRRGPPAVTQA